jgi:hypothetical protein
MDGGLIISNTEFWLQKWASAFNTKLQINTHYVTNQQMTFSFKLVAVALVLYILLLGISI